MDCAIIERSAITAGCDNDECGMRVVRHVSLFSFVWLVWYGFIS